MPRRHKPPKTPPAPAAQSPDAGTPAEAWIALYRRRIERASPPGSPPPLGPRASRTALRTAAFRAGDFTETPLSVES